MKKQLLIISVLVIIVSIFVSCSANSSDESISTTAVTDSKGTTHYYEPVTDDKGNVSTTVQNKGVFAEIETQSDGKAVTDKNGTYVTNEHTTVLPIEVATNNTSSTTASTTKKSTSDITKDIDDADNEVNFEPDETTDPTPTITTTIEKETTNTISTTKTITKTTTQKETQPATDKDGWVTKWY